MNTNFYYGSLISIGDNDASHIRSGNIFWISDGSVSNRHPYLIANSFTHEKNAVIHTWVIDSKPYFSDMVPFTMNNSISYVNPFKMVTFKRSDIRREFYHGTINDEVFEQAFNMYSLMFNKYDVDDIISRYENYIKRFFTKYRELAIEQLMMNENPLIFQTSIIDFNLLDFLDVTTDKKKNNLDSFEIFEVNEKEVREFYYTEMNKDTNASDFAKISDDEKILFIGLKKLYKIKDICIALNISSATYYRKVEEFKNTIQISDVFVKMGK